MKALTLPQTDVVVSRLGFGLGTLHHAFSQSERARLLSAATDGGITHFDTAPFYGFGLADADLGRFLKGRRNRFTLTTKIGLYPLGGASGDSASVWLRKAAGRVAPSLALPVEDWSLSRAQRSLAESLKRLQTDYVDFLLLHEPLWPQVPAEAILAWLEGEQRSGRVRAFGVAGSAERVSPFLQSHERLCGVAQTKDSLEAREADFLIAAGRALQFTYGYQRNGAVDWRKALERNATGCIIFSSRRVERVQAACASLA